MSEIKRAQKLKDIERRVDQLDEEQIYTRLIAVEAILSEHQDLIDGLRRRKKRRE